MTTGLVLVGAVGAGSLAWGAEHREPPTQAARQRAALTETRRVLHEWRAAEEARPCVTAAYCARRTVIVDGSALEPTVVERALFQRWMAKVASNGDVTPIRLDEDATWREALATALFLHEVQRAAEPLATSHSMAEKAKELAATQARELAALTPAERAQMAEAAPQGVADPSSPETVAAYARYLARQQLIAQLFDGPQGQAYDVGKARAWLAARLAARTVTVHGVDVPDGAALASHLVLTGRPD